MRSVAAEEYKSDGDQATIGPVALAVLEQLMVVKGVTETQVKDNLSRKEHFNGELAEMSTATWERLCTGLAKMPDKQPEQPIVTDANGEVIEPVNGTGPTPDANHHGPGAAAEARAEVGKESNPEWGTGPPTQEPIQEPEEDVPGAGPEEIDDFWPADDMAGMHNASNPARDETVTTGEPCTEKQRKLVYAKSKAAGVDDDSLHQIVRMVGGVESSRDLPFDKVDDVLAAIADFKPAQGAIV
jgi:hypothetical protein